MEPFGTKTELEELGLLAFPQVRAQLSPSCMAAVNNLHCSLMGSHTEWLAVGLWKLTSWGQSQAWTLPSCVTLVLNLSLS